MGHPLEKFKFCPVCGSRRWVEHDFKSKACQDCGFVYYANPSSATAAFILNGRGELLVVRRAKEPSKGTLDLPGGFVDIGEDIEQGMRREIAEETGLVVEDIKYIFSTPNEYVYSDMLIHTLDSDYLVRVGEQLLKVQTPHRVAFSQGEACAVHLVDPMWYPADDAAAEKERARRQLV